MMDSSSWKAYGKIDPELEAMLPAMPPSVSFADYGSADNLRKSIGEQFAQMIAAGILQLPDLTGITKTDIEIPVRDGSSIRALHYRPETGEAGPLFVYFHGGGWTFGFPEAWESGIKILASELGFHAVCVAYRKAPEAVFPTAVNDAWDATEWLANNASDLGADLSRGFIVGGASAGGNLAAVVTHEASDKKLSPAITGQFLSVPMVVHPDAVPEEYKPHYTSEEEFKEGMVLDRRGIQFLLSNYKMDSKSPYGSPLLWPSGHKSQPPTYFQVCGMDPFRDDSLIYEYLLREECGVPTRVDVYGGLPHGGTDFLPMLTQSKKALRDAKAGFEWLLSQRSG